MTIVIVTLLNMMGSVDNFGYTSYYILTFLCELSLYTYKLLARCIKKIFIKTQRKYFVNNGIHIMQSAPVLDVAPQS